MFTVELTTTPVGTLFYCFCCTYGSSNYAAAMVVKDGNPTWELICPQCLQDGPSARETRLRRRLRWLRYEPGAEARQMVKDVEAVLATGLPAVPSYDAWQRLDQYAEAVYGAALERVQ